MGVVRGVKHQFDGAHSGVFIVTAIVKLHTFLSLAENYIYFRINPNK